MSNANNVPYCTEDGARQNDQTYVRQPKLLTRYEIVSRGIQQGRITQVPKSQAGGQNVDYESSVHLKIDPAFEQFTLPRG